MALGFILVGTADHDVVMDMFHVLMEKSATELQDPNMRFLALGIGLIYLGERSVSLRLLFCDVGSRG